MINVPAITVNIRGSSRGYQQKKAFQSLLLWKAFNIPNIAFSGQLYLLLYNYDNRNVYNTIHNTPCLGYY